MERLSLVHCALCVLFAACGGTQDSEETTQEQSMNAPVETEPEVRPEAESEPEEAADPHSLPTTIDGLVERFDGSFGLWLNGLTPTVAVPETASARAVLEEMFTLVSFDQGRVTEFEVVEERAVQIDEDEYTALRLTTNQGPKIVLIRYRSGEWWTRVYAGQAP
ncbi:MAG: hypothetical protein AB8H86_18805 [Polyangiales bacterium]